jgi:subtilisin family serine protease
MTEYSDKEPGSKGSSDDEPASKYPGNDIPAGKDPGGDEPAGKDPGGDEPNRKDPGGDEPDGEKPDSRWPRNLDVLILVILAVLFILVIMLRGLTPDYPPEEFFVQDQLIVSGPIEQVNQAIDSLEPGTVTRDRRLEFGQFPSSQWCPGLSVAEDAGQLLVTDLYSITGSDAKVAEVIQAIRSNDGQVTAEPNWVSGSPWEVEGSPWEVEGSPWEVEGSSAGPGESPRSVTAPAEADTFMQQWAWDAIEFTAPASPADVKPAGNGIRVGVFDTSPFEGKEESEPPWLTVLHPPPAATLPPSDRDKKSEIDVSDHGLFVAGLIHAAAPDSNIELIRVLGKDKRGDLFTLNQALFDFMGRVEGGEEIGGVINLSLGIRVPPTDTVGFEGLPRQVQSFQDLLALARCSGIVVVAAAGNNSANDSIPELANLPAAWSSVNGVSASNIAGGRACFSNQGDIAAPGGDGREPDNPRGQCRPRIAECDGPDCPFGVVGPVLNSESSIEYAFWTGSSFATPMVTGLATQVLEAGDGEFTPADVRAILECGANRTANRYLGAGVINVQRTLDECLQPLLEAAAE